MIFQYECTQTISCSSQSAYQLSWIDGAAVHFLGDAKRAGVTPRNIRVCQTFSAGYFPSAVEALIAVNTKFAENLLEPCQNISQARKIPRRRFGKRHAPGTATCARTYIPGFQYRNGLIRRNLSKPRSSGQPGESASNHAKVQDVRKRLLPGGSEIKVPGRVTPVVRSGSSVHK